MAQGERLFKPCPFCGTQPKLREVFGKLVASCEGEQCTLQPSTWMTCRDAYDIRKVAKHWNKRPSEEA